MAHHSFIVRVILEYTLDDLPILQPNARAEVDVDGAFEDQIRVGFRVDLRVVRVASRGFIAEVCASISSDRTQMGSARVRVTQMGFGVRIT